MGSSGWMYFTPYTSDISQALSDLRRFVYESGEYEDPDRDGIDYIGQLIPRLNPQEQDEYLQAHLLSITEMEPDFDVTAIKSLEDLKKHYEGLYAVRTIDDFPHNIEFGTHSILDIVYIADKPGESYSVGPLPSEELLTYFGTEYPTHRQVEDNYGRSAGYGHRKYYMNGSGVYFIVYKEQQPDEICFCGVSGGV
ncbi:MAG: hypothetical protein H0U76_28130 [Ktedonobacteraceae bacterium]|nr:hypothetical protein [Ktedonobacteraceae bacterium]